MGSATEDERSTATMSCLDFGGMGSNVHWKDGGPNRMGGHRNYQRHAVDLTIPCWVASPQSPTLLRQTYESWQARKRCQPRMALPEDVSGVFPIAYKRSSRTGHGWRIRNSRAIPIATS